MEHKMVETNPKVFTATLYEKMCRLSPAVHEMALYEFGYALHNLTPPDGWAGVTPLPQAEIERMVNERAFYDRIQIKPTVNGRIVLEEKIVRLNQMLFVGMVSGNYALEWVKAHFSFDVRGFFFLHRTTYFTDKVIAHFGGKPYRQFEPKQKAFEHVHEIGYKAFLQANAEVDALFISAVKKIIAACGTPILLAIAGPTAAGKTEIVERLREVFEQDGQKVTSIELDNFLTDREEREIKGIFTQGKEAFHLDLLQQSLEDITHGKKISIPRYDFVYATSSHNLDGTSKPDGVPIEIEPADIIFMEGNFPFLIPEVVHLVGIKVVYLTDDPVRMKRKWRRDVDYRKKYEPTYFRNRYFKDQFIMAEIAYRPQLEVCDLAVDTTGAALWATPDMAAIMGEA
jgi:uridine kinase